MTDFENVSELVNKTGVSFEEARYAYEACGRDMLAAAEQLRKAHNKNSDFSDTLRNAQNNFRKGGRCAAECAGNIFGKLCRNYVIAAGKREYFSVPVLAAVICILLFGEVLVPVMLVSLFFGVTYTFCGPDFSKEFVFGFIKSAPVHKPAPNSTYSETSDEYCDKGFFNN